LSSQQSVRDFSAEIHHKESKIDVLIHNAGIALSFTNYQSVDGIELTMATNHYGPFLLTHLLIDLLKRSAPSRVVVVASKGYFLAKTKVNPNTLQRFYTGGNYFDSKMANILFTLELARRLRGTEVTANCLHPGIINTNIFRDSVLPLKLMMRLFNSCWKTEPEGAATTVYVATATELETVSGKYFRDCRMRNLLSRVRNSTADQIRLWEISKLMVQLNDQDPKI
jgi:NAD(P)-dependent dehydrogenase (short-subunit alcohol dehydrogenase family)